MVRTRIYTLNLKIYKCNKTLKNYKESILEKKKKNYTGNFPIYRFYTFR